MKRRVVITGAGCITPLGSEVRDVWVSLLKGRSGAGPISLFDAANYPVRIAAEVRDWSIADIDEDPDLWDGLPRQNAFAYASAVKAARQAGLPTVRTPPRRIGVYLGCGEIFPDFLPMLSPSEAKEQGFEFDAESYIAKFRRLRHPNIDMAFEPGAVAVCVAGKLGLQGPTANYTAACVSSSMAIGEATEAIRRNDADVMVAGGAHSMIHPLGLTGFCRLSTLSTRNEEPERAARPFDRNREGFVVGEGGAVVVLEELEHARRRGAEILGEVTGYGCTHDAYRITDPREDGHEAGRCIVDAMRQARLNPEDIDYINAHGSGTVANDKTETLAVKQALGRHAYRVPISSTKSMTGHLTTACGALEFIITLKALTENVVPPTTNYETPDPECDLDYVPNEARALHCQDVLTNSFGFGGQNVCLAISQFNG